MLVDFFGLPKQLEVLLIIIAGIAFLAFDSSLFDMKSNLDEIWNYDYHPSLQEYYVETFLMYTLSGIVFVRTFTTHVFLALYIVMLWPAIFADRPNLMVPWLMVGSIRCIAANVITLVLGSYVCISEKGHHPICFDFFLSQIIEHGPSLYAWLTILSYYKTLQIFCNEERKNTLELELAIRRRKARLMGTSQSHFDEKVDDGRNLLSESTLDNLIHHLEGESSMTFSRSLDSLLKLKSSNETKEEIMFSDLFSEDEQGATILEKAMKLLNVEDEDILRALTERANGSLSGEIDKEIDSTSSSSLDNEETNVDTLEEMISGTTVDKSISEDQPTTIKKPIVAENEVEIGCFSFEPDKATACQTPEVKDIPKETKKTGEEENKVTKQDFLEKVADAMQNEIKKMTHFGCQVSTLSRTLLRQSPEEVTKKFRFSKKIILNAW